MSSIATSAAVSIAASSATSRATEAASKAGAEIKNLAKNNIIVETWQDTSPDKRAKILYGVGIVFFAIFLGILFVQTLFFTRSASRNRESFVIFTDGDVDDLLAINMLFRRSDVAAPLIVVSGNGLATPYSAFKNVRNFILTLAGDGSSVAKNTRVVMGSAMATRDAIKAFVDTSSASSSATTSSVYQDSSLYCTYSRFARSSLAISIAANSLYGQSEYLASLARTATASTSNNNNNNIKNYAAATSLNMFTEFGKVINGALQTGTKITLLSLAPMTDMSTLLDALPSDTISKAINLLVVSGGRFATSTNSGVSDAGLFTRDNGLRGSVGSYSELNFFLDPEAAQNILSPDSRYTSTLLPTVVVPADVAGSVSAYTDFPDQWSKISSVAANSGSATSKFLARLLTSFSTFEGPTFFPYKGTPKSIAAVAVALDRTVRNQLYAMKQSIAVMTYSTADALHLPGYVGRSGATSKTSTSTELGVGMPDIVVGFSAATTASTTSTGMSRVFLDSYFSFVALPWI